MRPLRLNMAENGYKPEHDTEYPSNATWEEQLRTRAMARFVMKEQSYSYSETVIYGYTWTMGWKIPFQRHGRYMRVKTPSGEVIDTQIESNAGDLNYKLATLLAWTNRHIQQNN